MNIALINADSIFWEADKNLRVVNFEHIMAKLNNVAVPDQTYFIGGLEDRDPFNESLKDIVQKCRDRGMEIAPVSSITQVDKHHNPELVLLDLLYRGVFLQSARMGNNFTIVSADASSVRSASFLAKKGLIAPVNYILADTIENLGEISATYNVAIRDKISLRPEDKTVEDRLAIRTVIETIRKGLKAEKGPFLYTMASLTKKVKYNCGINPVMVRPLVLSLIHQGYLVRQKFETNETERNGIVLGENAEELLDKMIRK